MLAERPYLRSRRESLAWTLSCFGLAARLIIGELVDRRPRAIVATSIYLATFSTYLLLHTALQIPNVHTSWTEAWFPVLASLSVTMLPAVCAVGVWSCDNLGRRMAMLFCAVDLGIALSFSRVVGLTSLRGGKIVVDLAIIAAMCLPSVKLACGGGQSNRSPLGLTL